MCWGNQFSRSMRIHIPPVHTATERPPCGRVITRVASQRALRLVAILSDQACNRMADAPVTQSLSEDDASLEYQAVEPLAVVSFVAGLLSPLAIVASLWCVVPLFGLVTAGSALSRIARDERRGRGLA